MGSVFARMFSLFLDLYLRPNLSLLISLVLASRLCLDFQGYLSLSIHVYVAFFMEDIFRLLSAFLSSLCVGLFLGFRPCRSLHPIM